MIHYHGIDGMDAKTLSVVMSGRHAFVSFAMPSNLIHVADICSTFALDNGAFSTWRKGKKYDFDGFLEWVEEWQDHSSYDFHLIPDIIDGTEFQNRKLIESWKLDGVPVWHMHESIEYLKDLCSGFDKVAIGSSGQYAVVGNTMWWHRITEAMNATEGSKARLHGLRMLRIDVFTKLPFHSADSTSAVRDSKYDKRWSGYNSPKSQHTRALVIADRLEAHQSISRWKTRPEQQKMFC